MAVDDVGCTRGGANVVGGSVVRTDAFGFLVAWCAAGGAWCDGVRATATPMTRPSTTTAPSSWNRRDRDPRGPAWRRRPRPPRGSPGKVSGDDRSEALAGGAEAEAVSSTKTSSPGPPDPLPPVAGVRTGRSGAAR